MVSQWICSVVHHVTSPSWYDEVKIDLTTTLTSKHHLLFTFVHVSCDLSKQKTRDKDREGGGGGGNGGGASAETVVGYSWLPLVHKGRLRVEQQSLPVSAHLPAGYLSFEPLGLGKGVSCKFSFDLFGQFSIFYIILLFYFINYLIIIFYFINYFIILFY